MKIHKGDTIQVIAGKDAGKKVKVENVNSKNGTVLASDVNTYKRHVKKSEQFPQGGIVELARPLDIAKVALICSKCNKMTRVGFSMVEGSKKRICKKCKAVIS